MDEKVIEWLGVLLDSKPIFSTHIRKNVHKAQAVKTKNKKLN